MNKSWLYILSFLFLTVSLFGQNDTVPIKIGYKNQDTSKAPILSIDQALLSQVSSPEGEGMDIVIRSRDMTQDIPMIIVYPPIDIDDFHSGENREVISLEKQPITYNTLGDLLSHQANLTIKNYGTEGMASSVSLRGAGSSRTQILWEGIPLNSISAGDNNLSLIPASVFSTIEINRTASATSNGSGTFGGSISCNSKPDWGYYGKGEMHKATADANLSYGSFNTFKSNVNYSLSALRKINYQGSFFYTQSDGDFDYYDYIRLENLKRQNADFQKYGTIQTLHFQHKKLTAQASLWYQVNDANLPALLGTTSSNVEHQTDSSLRYLLKINYNINDKNILHYTTAYINDYELYTQKITPTAETYSTYSEIQNQTNTHILNFTHWINDNFNFLTELQGKWAKADIDNYGEAKTEYSTAGIVKLAYKEYFGLEKIDNYHHNSYRPYLAYKNRFSSVLSIRKEFNSQYTIPFIANWGSELYLGKSNIELLLNIGNKYRTPTFNDLYWTGWGNPDLKPESGWTAEFGANKHFSVLDKHDNEHTIILDASTYYSVINDMIMWTPSGSVWHPYNTAQVVLQGFEMSIIEKCSFKTICKIQYKISDTVAQHSIPLTLRMNNKLTANINNPHISKTYDQMGSKESVGHILYYVPKYEIHYKLHINSELGNYFILGKRQKPNCQLKTLIDNCDFILFVNYESPRYYTLTKTLDDFVTIDASLQKTFSFHPYKDDRHDDMKITIGAHVRNLTNTIYEQVRSYPLPGRNYEISLRGQF